MRSSQPSAGCPAFYTIPRAAWILGVEPATVSRLVRVGTLRAVRRRDRLVIPASSLVRLLGAPTDHEAGHVEGREAADQSPEVDRDAL